MEIAHDSKHSVKLLQIQQKLNNSPTRYENKSAYVQNCIKGANWITVHSMNRAVTRLLFWAEFQSPPLPRNPGKSSFLGFKSSFLRFQVRL